MALSVIEFFCRKSPSWPPHFQPFSQTLANLILLNLCFPHVSLTQKTLMGSQFLENKGIITSRILSPSWFEPLFNPYLIFISLLSFQNMIKPRPPSANLPPLTLFPVSTWVHILSRSCPTFFLLKFENCDSHFPWLESGFWWGLNAHKHPTTEQLWRRKRRPYLFVEVDAYWDVPRLKL